MRIAKISIELSDDCEVENGETAKINKTECANFVKNSNHNFEMNCKSLKFQRNNFFWPIGNFYVNHTISCVKPKV